MSIVPLNQRLYDRLQQRYGSVMFANQGQSLMGGFATIDSARRAYNVTYPGEYYRICCPFCVQRGAVDTRHRLWINHRWGVGPDGDHRERLWHLAICYNENCLQNPEFRRELRTAVYGSIGREMRPSHEAIRRGTFASGLGRVELPGECRNVHLIPPNSSAALYLDSRGLDRQRLGERLKVSYCYDSPEFPMASGRIIVPTYMRGTMVGWQARYVGDLDWNAARIPKYWTRPRTNKSQMLYGFDEARSLPFCFVVEGVSDVWAIGEGAVALLGKSMSQQQFDLIRSCWQAAVVVLDGDAQEEAHAIHQRLSQVIPSAIVRLPAGSDPATIAPDDFWDMVYQATSSQGVDLCELANAHQTSTNPH